MTASEDLLRALAAADTSCLDSVLSAPATRASTGEPADRPWPGAVLEPDARAVVRLAALLAVDGPTASVCWAADLATVTGVPDDGLVAVLVAVMSSAQTAEAELTASRLAAALN